MSAAGSSRGAFLPDFCQPANLLRTVLFAQLLAFILVAVGSGGLAARLESLALVTLFIQWVAILDVALLCALRRPLERHDRRVAVVLAFLLLQLVTVAVTLGGHAIGLIVGMAMFTQPLPVALIEHTAISAIVTALGLRYFYVSAEWQRKVEEEAHARIEALQARIRPHFLFNSMNTIASLTRSDPVAAEAAVEDLAELYRAALSQRALCTLAEEVAFTASYLRIEGTRLGERLALDWALDPAADGALLPTLTLQPLAENAVYHGIEGRPEGGTIAIRSELVDGRVRIEVANPAPPLEQRRDGQRLAQDNVRQRLAHHFGAAAQFDAAAEAERYRVTITVPLEPER